MIKALLLLFAALNSSAATVQDVYYRVLSESRFSPRDITFVIEESSVDNAYANIVNGKKVVIITTAMIESLHYNEDQVAMILAHEIAHHSLQHLRYKISDQIIRETDADILGHRLATQAGYDKCAGYAIWMQEMVLNSSVDYLHGINTHPKLAVRAEYFRKLCNEEF